MRAKLSKRQKRIIRILDFLRTYSGFTDNYGCCVKSVDLLNGCNRQLTVEGPTLMQDIIRAYNQYDGECLDDLYRDVCKDSGKRPVYQGYLWADWKRAIKIFYSEGLSIPGITKEEALTALKNTYELVK